MKILHFLSRRALPYEPADEGTGGITRVALELARAQHHLGHDVWVVTTARRTWQRVWNGVTLAALPEARWAPLHSRRYLLDLRIHIPFVRFCHEQRFDVVHGHEYPFLRFVRAPLRIAYIHNDPFWTERDPGQWWYQAQEFGILQRHSDLRIAVSRYVARQLHKGGKAVSRELYVNSNNERRTRVVHNGVDAVRFASARSTGVRYDLRRQWGIGDDEVVFFFAGAIAAEKGVIHLARAFGDLALKTPNIRLLLAGGAALWGNDYHGARPEDQSYEAEVGALLASAIQRDSVHHLGVLSASQMPAVYAASDVFVLPSLNEACPLVILEALASGLPIIASSVGGIPELTSRDNAILIPAEDSAALAAAMSTLVNDQQLRGRLAKNAELAARSMTWSRAAEHLDGIYAEFGEAEFL
jgi:glycosyltransferase involved in cell wall biosynthesis